jgi:hypothetical protein
VQRIREREARRAEEARQRREEVQAKRRKLFELHDGGDLPLEAYHEALSLIEKPGEQLSPGQRRLRGLLDALLKDAISADLYLQSREAIISKPPSPPGERTVAPPEPSGPRHPRPEPPAVKYCIHCGAQLHPGNQFCFGCGRRIQT